MQLPEVALTATHYFPDGRFETTDADISEFEKHLAEACFDYGDEALQRGNPPVGAVLVDNEHERFWGAGTVDKTVKHILAHAEIRAYDLAQPELGNDLSQSTLITTAQPCTTCAAPYAEGKIGKIIFAASRPDIFAISGLMRPRMINLHEMLVDGATDTIVISGYQAQRALGNFAIWAQLRDAGKVEV